jgi:hypothetical protein
MSFHLELFKASGSGPDLFGDGIVQIKHDRGRSLEQNVRHENLFMIICCKIKPSIAFGKTHLKDVKLRQFVHAESSRLCSYSLKMRLNPVSESLSYNPSIKFEYNFHSTFRIERIGKCRRLIVMRPKVSGGVVGQSSRITGILGC